MKRVTFAGVKKQEAGARLGAARKARLNPAAAKEQQNRASLVGKGSKWRMTNLRQVAAAMAKWA